MVGCRTYLTGWVHQYPRKGIVPTGKGGGKPPVLFEEVGKMDKPTAEQVAWVFEKLCEHAKEGGSYRSLIYDRMGFNGKAYAPLHKAGGMVLTNIICDWRKMKGIND